MAEKPRQRAQAMPESTPSNDAQRFQEELFEAIGNGDEDTVRKWVADGRLARGVDLRGLSGLTPLMAAVREGSTEMVEVLLPVSDPNATLHNGQTAFLFSVQPARRHFATEAMFDLLLPVSSPRHADNKGMTALHHAARWGMSSRVRKLVPLSDVNAQTKDERLTPLMGCFEGLRRAKMEDVAKAVEILAPISDLRLTDEAGMTALDHADSADHHEGWDIIASMNPSRELARTFREHPRLTAALEAMDLKEAIQTVNAPESAIAGPQGLEEPQSDRVRAKAKSL